MAEPIQVGVGKLIADQARWPKPLPILIGSKGPNLELSPDPMNRAAECVPLVIIVLAAQAHREPRRWVIMNSVLENPADAVARAITFAQDPVRVEIVRRTGLLDAGLQESLQRYTRLAAKLTGAPTSVVSVIDADRQYFSGAFGMDLEETPLDASYCKHVIADDVQLVVGNALDDEVLATNRATVDLGVRAYLGSPVSAGGARIGAICVIDERPRSWSDDEREILDDLALAVTTDIELRLRTVAQEEMALTDALTGVGNRRAMATALEEMGGLGGRAFVGILDLNGFKAYNDTFGHPAGDDLLVRLAGRLRGVCRDDDAVFRMGGDEFCMISRGRENLLAAQKAIEDRGPGFCITAELGIASFPDDASDVTSAIGVADRRMYAAKHLRSSAAGYQVANVLVQTLTERNRPLSGHSESVSRLACGTGEALGVKAEELQAIEVASRLHDIGKMAISDHVLDKPGPLTPAEWEQMRAHTLIGERIVATAPSLTLAARLVRSSHERVDGGGYPDGLTGEQIPLGSRIIFACDAYDAMTTDRPYRTAMSAEDARAELKRNAGTQFDPAVVRALLSLSLAPRAAPLLAA